MLNRNILVVNPRKNKSPRLGSLQLIYAALKSFGETNKFVILKQYYTIDFLGFPSSLHPERSFPQRAKEQEKGSEGEREQGADLVLREGYQVPLARAHRLEVQGVQGKYVCEVELF